MDVEKTMELILGVQAKLEASVQGHDERLAKLETSVATVTELVGRLTQAEIRLVERMDQMTAGFQELRNLHAETDRKLQALIDTVNKLTGRDGRKK